MADLPRIGIISLCTGGGGLDVGLARALSGLVSARACLYAEREASALDAMEAAIRQGELESASLWSDVSRVPVGFIRKLSAGGGNHLGLVAGFPCQPWSRSGKRKGRGDDRWLWPSIARWVRATRPVFVALENVPEITRGGMGCVIDTLAKVGLYPAWRSAPASIAGSPQRRERTFILAVSPGLRGWLADADDIASRGDVRKWIDEASPAGEGLAYGDLQHEHLPEERGKGLRHAAGRGAMVAGGVAEFPPGPGVGDFGRWRSILGKFPLLSPAALKKGSPAQVIGEVELPSIESVLRRMADGLGVDMARGDWLHVLGNGVCPQQAERVFRALIVDHAQREREDRRITDESSKKP